MSFATIEGLVAAPRPYNEGSRDQSVAQVTRLASARLPTIYGEFDVTAYADGEGKEHLLLRIGDRDGKPPIVRIHSECLTGDALGSIRCDCREQLLATLSFFGRERHGVLIYMRQEGRGIGLANKLLAYALQDKGMDTVEANLHLGFPADGRTYGDAAAILRDQGMLTIRLLTNNPRKIAGLEAHQIRIVERIQHTVLPGTENRKYLETKAAKLGHLLGL